MGTVRVRFAGLGAEEAAGEASDWDEAVRRDEGARPRFFWRMRAAACGLSGISAVLVLALDPGRGERKRAVEAQAAT